LIFCEYAHECEYVEKEKKIIEKEKGKKGQGLMSANTRKIIEKEKGKKGKAHDALLLTLKTLICKHQICSSDHLFSLT
jgi:hypothetical protein